MTPPAPGVIEVRLRELSQLFNSLDPSPFVEKDLDQGAEEYIVDSLRELDSGTATTLLIHLDQGDAVHEDVAQAIHEHFARRSLSAHRKLGRLIRRGLISLCIGLAFLAAAFGIAQMVRGRLGQSGWQPLFEQGLLIVGWVAMWRPLEIFLYDWWPIVGECRLYDRLKRIDVKIVPVSSSGRTV